MDAKKFLDELLAQKTAPLTELQKWAKKYKDILSDGYTHDQVVYIAQRCDFDLGEACKLFSHFQDAMEASDIKNRVAIEMFRLESQAEDREKQRKEIELAKQRKVYLLPLWSDLVTNNFTGKAEVA